MPNCIAHRVGAAIAVGSAFLAAESQREELSHAPVTGTAIAATCANLPDLLEPATNPHHRQFFHGVAFGGIVGYGMYKAYQWQPETDFDRFVRLCLLAAGAGVLIHLAMDSVTPRSIPLLGKL